MSAAMDSIDMRRDLREAVQYHNSLLNELDDANMYHDILSPERLAQINTAMTVGQSEIVRLREALEGMEFD
jgi:hypothetical protein